ncbi:MAG: hypothetical protein WC796_06195 [Candidatus Pacearchaeota archaeon]|jgi:hypothetical protein
MKGDKKGISDVIVTVLMILLVVAAIAIIWAVLANFLNTGVGGVDIQTKCMNTVLKVLSASNTTAGLNITVEYFSGNDELSDVFVFIGGTKINDFINESGVNPKVMVKTGERINYLLPLTSFSKDYGGREIEVAPGFDGQVCNTKSASVIITKGA